MKKILMLAAVLSLTGCTTQRIWLLETMADALDPHPQIMEPAE